MADKEFLEKIGDHEFLIKLYEEFQRGDANRDLRSLFSDNQIRLMKQAYNCIYAVGVRTFGYEESETGDLSWVCRCPYAADEKLFKCNECGNCHRYYKPVPQNRFTDEILRLQKEAAEKSVEEPPPPKFEKTEVVPEPEPIIPDFEPVVPESAIPVPESVISESDSMPPKQESAAEEPEQSLAPTIHDDLIPDVLNISCGGYDFVGVNSSAGYEIRVTVDGCFVANINAYGIVMGNNPKIIKKENAFAFAGLADVCVSSSERGGSVECSVVIGKMTFGLSLSK